MITLPVIIFYISRYFFIFSAYVSNLIDLLNFEIYFCARSFNLPLMSKSGYIIALSILSSIKSFFGDFFEALIVSNVPCSFRADNSSMHGNESWSL